VYAATIELLTQKGRFQTDQALALAEAIDMAIGEAQLVTVPILDARFAAFKAEMKAEIDVCFERLRVQMIIAMVLSNAALGPLGAAAWDALRRAL